MITISWNPVSLRRAGRGERMAPDRKSDLRGGVS